MHALADHRRGILLLVGAGCLLGTPAAAQPLCDVLLRPAFHYTSVGNTVLLQDSSSGFLEQTSCNWDFGDGALAAQTTYAHTYAQPGIYPVCYTITDSVSGCSSTFCRQVVVPLDPCANTQAAFEETPLGNNTIALVDVSMAPSGIDRLWEFGDGSGDSLGTTSHFWPLPGRHFVSLTRHATDFSCATTTGRWLNVDGNGSTCGTAVFADFTWQDQGGQLLLEPALQTNGAVVAGVVWSFGDDQVDTSWTAVHTYLVPGRYQVCMLAGSLLVGGLDSCFALVCKTIDTQAMLSVNEAGQRPSLQAHPNPFREQLEVNTPETDDGTPVRLLDTAGREVLRAMVAHGRAVLEGGPLAPGVYVVDVSSPEGPQRLRVVRH